MTTDTDLAHCSDPELDSALRILYSEHRNAKPDERLELHMAIIDILAEQAIRYQHLLPQPA